MAHFYAHCRRRPTVGISPQCPDTVRENAGYLLQLPDDDIEVCREFSRVHAVRGPKLQFRAKRSGGVFAPALETSPVHAQSPSFSNCIRARWAARIICARALAVSGEMAWSFRKWTERPEVSVRAGAIPSTVAGSTRNHLQILPKVSRSGILPRSTRDSVA